MQGGHSGRDRYSFSFLRSELLAAPDFRQAMAGARIQIQAIELLEFAYAVQRCLAERRLAVKGVQHDAFEDVAKGHVVILGEAFQDFEDALFHADAGLDAFDKEFRIGHAGTNVPGYTRRFQQAFERKNLTAVAADGTDQR